MGEKFQQTAEELEAERQRVAAAAAGDQQALAELLVQYAPLFRAEAGRNWLPYLSEDLQGMAQLYFLEAVKTYDPKRGVPFAAYLKSKVHGGISTFAAAERRRRQREMKPEDYHPAKGEQAPGAEAGNVWDAVFEAAAGLEAYSHDLDTYARVEVRESLKEAFKHLTDREREILVSVYVSRKSLRETAEHLGLCQQRISQLKKRLLEKLRRALL